MTKPIAPPVPRPFQRRHLRELLAETTAPFVSIYMPLQRTFSEMKKNALLYRQAVQAASGRLGAAPLSSDEVKSWTESLGAVEKILQPVESTADGMAVFLDRSGLRVHTLTRPVAFSVSVGDYPVLRPLLQAIHLDRRYRVLGLSVNRVALFEGDANGLGPAKPSGIPSSMEEALGSRLVGRQLQYRSSAMRGRGPISHGQGGAGEERYVDLKRFHQAIAKALEKRLPDDGRLLVLATDATHEGEFRAIARLPGLLPESAAGNPDHLSLHELHERTWPLVEATIRARDQEAGLVYESARNRGKAVDLLDDVGAAAVGGRVRRLWLEAYRREPGGVDPKTGRIERSVEGDTDVLDELAVLAIRHGGEVMVVEAENMPTITGAAAELR